jgi:peptidyl-prolyl cis-trans isomerase-like 6
VIFKDGVILGSCEDFLTWAKEKFGYIDMRPLPFYYSVAKDAYNEYITSQDRCLVYMDISVEGEPYGRLVFELFTSVCPQTCENFKALCTGEKGTTQKDFALCYKNSFIHRIVPNGWIQGGDILGGSGGCSLSSDGNLFPDECFAIQHDSAGTLGMVNQGPNTNGSQFYITLQPTPWMDKQYVAFGRLVEGSKTLAKLRSLETQNERPVRDVIIRDCGIVQKLDVLRMT